MKRSKDVLLMYCPKCGAEYREGFCKCLDCDADLVEEKTIIVKDKKYASILKRIGALIIDLAIVLAIIAPFLYCFIRRLANSSADTLSPSMITLFSGMIEIIPYWLYFSLFESSRLRATIGKIIFKIYVTDLDGARVTFIRATVRCLLKLISFFLIGILSVLISEKHQSFHDNAAKTIVVNIQD